MVEESLQEGIQWAVFEPNCQALWQALKLNIASYLNGLWRAGAFQGETADQAYFVRCGLGVTMTQAEINEGKVIIEVGFAPLKPAELRDYQNPAKSESALRKKGNKKWQLRYLPLMHIGMIHTGHLNSR